MIGITTPAEIDFASRITSHHNGNCCCMSCEPAFCFTCGHYSDFCACLVAVIVSPNYCTGRPAIEEVPF